MVPLKSDSISNWLILVSVHTGWTSAVLTTQATQDNTLVRHRRSRPPSWPTSLGLMLLLPPASSVSITISAIPVPGRCQHLHLHYPSLKHQTARLAPKHAAGFCSVFLFKCRGSGWSPTRTWTWLTRLHGSTSRFLSLSLSLALILSPPFLPFHSEGVFFSQVDPEKLRSEHSVAHWGAQSLGKDHRKLLPNTMDRPGSVWPHTRRPTPNPSRLEAEWSLLSYWLQSVVHVSHRCRLSNHLNYLR